MHGSPDKLPGVGQIGESLDAVSIKEKERSHANWDYIVHMLIPPGAELLIEVLIAWRAFVDFADLPNPRMGLSPHPADPNRPNLSRDSEAEPQPNRCSFAWRNGVMDAPTQVIVIGKAIALGGESPLTIKGEEYRFQQRRFPSPVQSAEEHDRPTGFGGEGDPVKAAIHTEVVKLQLGQNHVLPLPSPGSYGTLGSGSCKRRRPSAAWSRSCFRRFALARASLSSS